MISNFSTEQSLKVIYGIKIPDTPLLFEPVSSFWLAICIPCLTSLSLQGEWIAFSLISIPFATTLNYLANRYEQIRKLENYKKSVEIMRRIVQTPTWEKGQRVNVFKFITCSDRLTEHLRDLRRDFC